MCSACEFRKAHADWTAAGAASADQRRADRQRMVAVLRRVLPAAGLHLSDGAGGLVVAGAAATRALPDPVAAWDAALALTGRPFDPLAPAILALTDDTAQ